MTMPSQRSNRDTLLTGRTLRSSGTITVGPVTTTKAPNSSAISSGSSRKYQVAVVTTAQVTRAPQVTSRRTVRSRPRISSNLRVSAPSNRMIDTARDTLGSNRSPNMAWGSISPRPPPSSRPDNRSGRIAGSLRRQAPHWHRKATTTIRASWIGRVSSMNILLLAWGCPVARGICASVGPDRSYRNRPRPLIFQWLAIPP